MDFFGRFGKKAATKNTAKDRLKLVLTHDRLNCSPKLLEMMQADILKVIQNYVEIDETESDIQLIQSTEEGRGASPVLTANFVVKSIRKRNP